MRPLGRSGLSIRPMAFGGNVFGWSADQASSFALLDLFIGSGFSFVDTADVYFAWAQKPIVRAPVPGARQARHRSGRIVAGSGRGADGGMSGIQSCACWR